MTLKTYTVLVILAPVKLDLSESGGISHLIKINSSAALSLSDALSLPPSLSLMCSKVPTVRCTRDAFKSQRSLSRWSERTKEGTVSPFSPFSFELNGGENGPNSVHSYRRNFSCSTASCSGARAVRSIFIGALHCGKDRKCISKHASKRACRCGDDMLCNKLHTPRFVKTSAKHEFL